MAVGETGRDLDPLPTFGGDRLGVSLQLVGPNLVDKWNILQSAAIVALKQVAQCRAAGRHTRTRNEAMTKLKLGPLCRRRAGQAYS